MRIEERIHALMMLSKFTGVNVISHFSIKKRESFTRASEKDIQKSSEESWQRRRQKSIMMI
jgi:hypothetical protein